MESWGIFMQLTNVMRDVAEDVGRNRIYLPLNELEANNITESELMDGTVRRNVAWEPYVREYVARARTYLEEARALLPLLPRRTRYSPAAMIAFYDKILRRIERAQGDVFSERIRLSKGQKLSLAAAVYLRHRFLPGFLDPVWGRTRSNQRAPERLTRSGLHLHRALLVPLIPIMHPRFHERSDVHADAREDLCGIDDALPANPRSNQSRGADPLSLDGPLLEVEEPGIEPDEPGSDLRPTPWSQAMSIPNARSTDDECGTCSTDPTEQSDAEREVIASQVEEDEVTTVVHLRIQVDVPEPRSQRPDMLLQRVKDRGSTNRASQHQADDSVVWVDHVSRLPSEGLDARDVSAENQVVDVMGPFVGLHGFKVGHVPHHGVLVQHTVRPVDVTGDLAISSAMSTLFIFAKLICSLNQVPSSFFLPR